MAGGALQLWNGLPLRAVTPFFLLLVYLVPTGAALTVMYALSDGGYSDDAELVFIQSFLQDRRLQALLRVGL